MSTPVHPVATPMQEMTSWRQKPEDEDEKDEKCKEGGDVIHRPQHDKELIAQSGQEAHDLQYAQQTERP